MNFIEFGLKKEALDAIEELGFRTPTEIQEKAIPILLGNEQKDFIGLAQTGTGKTAAFGLPLIHITDVQSRDPEALILCPTRELCLQITEDLRGFSKFLPGLRITAVYGGASIGEQIKEIRRGTQIVVATPGRLLDLIRRGKINIAGIKNCVLDEADIMLNMGFKEELDGILEETPDSKRIMLFSATMPPEVARIASDYMTDPAEVTVGKKNAGAENIEHSYCMVHSRDKYPALKRLLDFHPNIYGIVFCRTKISTQQIADKLIKDGYNAESLHGDLSQSQRDMVMKKFRTKNIQILVATDVAARGLDVENLSHIIHFDLPDEPENYIHRSGRTGRAGRTGSSIAIINMKEKYRVQVIERRLKKNIKERRVPAGPAICEKQLIHLIDRVHTVNVDEPRIAPFMAVIEEKLAALDREALLKHFVSLEFNRFLSYYRDAKDINPKVPQYQRSSSGKGGGNKDSWGKFSSKKSSYGKKGKSKFIRVCLNLGRKDKFLPPQAISLIKQSTKIRNIELGKIDIESSWSIVQVEGRYADVVLQKTDGFTYRGKKVSVSLK